MGKACGDGERLMNLTSITKHAERILWRRTAANAQRWIGNIYQRLEEPINVKHIFTPLFLSGYCYAISNAMPLNTVSIPFHLPPSMNDSCTKKVSEKLLYLLDRFFVNTVPMVYCDANCITLHTVPKILTGRIFLFAGAAQNSSRDIAARCRTIVVGRTKNVRAQYWRECLECYARLRLLHHANDRIPIIIGFYASRFCVALISIRIL